MAKTQAKRHHWWPECVSKHWADSEGGVHWLLPDGEVRRSRPANFGVIGNGHSIKLGADGEDTVWDSNFEGEYQSADDAFPRVIEWMDALDCAGPPFERAAADRVLPQQVSESDMAELFASLVSLAIRSPMHRERSVSLAESMRGPLNERERNTLIGANMHRAQRTLVKNVGGRGKALVLFSPEKEFIFGDGFYHNLYPPADHTHDLTMLVPVTPWMSVLYKCPMAYRVEPRLTTMTINIAEAETLNDVVQVHAKSALFYRTEQPEIKYTYSQGKHLIYRHGHNPVDAFVRLIPGIRERGSFLAGFGTFG